jgi:prepilin peptidase dependent protein C
MSDALKHEQGFSLPETLLAMTLTGYGGHRAWRLSAWAGHGFIQLNQYRQLWRDAWRYGQLNPPEIPPAGPLAACRHRRQRCVSITVTITMPVDKRVQMTRLHCPVSQ